jgi:DNA-binding NtrC family response regulator
LESELFGHEKGSFTGADHQRKGRFEMANGGTLLLDEVGAMSLAAQVKLLRAVEYRQFERVGGEQTLTADVRIVALTNQSLDKLIAAGHFRADLFNRLNEIHIEVPPLRERREDIPMLCEKFLAECRRRFKRQPPTLSTAALEVLKRHHWPGNLRELRATIHRAVVLAEHDHIYAEDLDLGLRLDSQPVHDHNDYSLTGMEKRHIAAVLAMTKGQKLRACQLLEISRPTLDKKIKDYGLGE